MKTQFLLGTIGALAGFSCLLISADIRPASAQEQQAAAADTADAAQAPDPLSDDELQVLVARIALYPDELVALVSAAAIYPLQVVEAERYLENKKKSPDLKPKDSWDGSVISLLNYPEIVKMMSEDLDWTQSLGEAIANQQSDVLAAIQQLRDKAVADKIIKSDERVTVVEEGDNVVIQSKSPDTIYIPQYEPATLYDPGYPPQPVTYYPQSYPSYYYPAAPYFAAAVTGLAFAAAVDWGDGGIWGGNWDGGDVDIDCNNCFNNRDFNGKVNFNDVDWKNVDRSKMNFNRDQLNNINRSDVKNRIEANDRNSMKNRVADAKRGNAGGRAGGNTVKDVRRSTLEGLNKGGGQRANAARPRDGGGPRAANAGAKRPGNASGGGKRPSQANRTGGKPRPGARADTRPRKPSALGQVQNGRSAKNYSNRGNKSMGGGSRSHAQPRRPSSRSYGGGGGRSAGGGGRRGGGGGGRGGGRRGR